MVEKSDCLFLILGTNPMPNLISISNRVKRNGKVFLIVTEGKGNNLFESKSIGQNIKSILNKKNIKIVEDLIVVDKNDENNIRDRLEEKYKMENGIIELNYTGGTKNMSSSSYKFFKEKMRENEKKIILSYFDNVSGKFIIENNIKSNKINYVEDSFDKILFNSMFTLNDIVSIHKLKLKIKKKDDYKYSEFGQKYGENFEHLSLDKKKSWIDELNLCCKKNDINLYLEFSGKYVSKDLKNSLSEKGIKEVRRYLLGDAFEEYFNNILIEYEREKIIDEYIWSAKTESSKIVKNDAEIDFLIKKGKDITLMSVTLCEEQEETKLKLYEAISRSKEISGDQCRIIFICLYESCKEMLNDICSLDIDVQENVNVIALDNFNNIKEKLRIMLM